MAEVLVVLLNAPQAELPQLTDQVTPAFAESLVTVAVSDAVAVVASEAGAPESVTEMALMVIVAEADLVGSVTEVAVTVTVLPVGIAVGAVYVAVLGVVFVNAPQAPALPQVTDHFTPAFAESVVTVAVSAAVASVRSEVGAPVSVTDVVGGGIMVVLGVPLPPQATSAAVAAQVNIPRRTRLELSQRLRRMNSLLRAIIVHL